MSGGWLVVTMDNKRMLVFERQSCRLCYITSVCTPERRAMQYCNPSLTNLWSVIPCLSINIWYLLQLIQMLQSRQHDLFTCFLNLACKEHLVENRIDLNPSS